MDTPGKQGTTWLHTVATDSSADRISGGGVGVGAAVGVGAGVVVGVGLGVGR